MYSAPLRASLLFNGTSVLALPFPLPLSTPLEGAWLVLFTLLKNDGIVSLGARRLLDVLLLSRVLDGPAEGARVTNASIALVLLLPHRVDAPSSIGTRLKGK